MWENCGTKKLSNFLLLIQLLSDRDRFWTQAVWLQKYSLTTKSYCTPYDVAILINAVSESITTANILFLLLPSPQPPMRKLCFAFHVTSTVLLGIIPTFPSLLVMNSVA